MSVPEPVPAHPDRRVRRTREALRDALLALLVERGWDDIDVQALCVRADIGRSTFYLHFPNKEALLRGSLADLREALRVRASGPPPGTAVAEPLAFLGGLIRGFSAGAGVQAGCGCGDGLEDGGGDHGPASCAG